MNDPCQSTPETAQGEKPSGGKKLSEIDQAKNDSTGKASDVGRQLGFAGIATVWLLGGQVPQAFGNILLIALTLLSAALLVDFLQYVYCSYVWRRFYNEHFNKHNSDDVCVDIPDKLSDGIYRFFWAKIILLIIGYVFLLAGVLIKLSPI